MGSSHINAINRPDLYSEQFHKFFIVTAKEGKAVRQLVIRIVTGMVKAGKHFRESLVLAAGISDPVSHMCLNRDYKVLERRRRS